MNREQDKYYTELDRALQQLALTDWATFVDLIGQDAVVSAKICILRSRGESIGKIQIKLGATKKKVRYHGEKCNCNNQKQTMPFSGT